MAGRIRDEDVALVRERTSIVDVVSEYVTLKPAGGGNVKGLCPFHDEKTPSFNVAAPKGVYFCYGCGAGGDAITFVMTQEHLSFVEAVERLTPQAVQSIANRVRTFDFFERSNGWDSAPERFRLHALATQHTADRLAAEVGYESEAAFNRAFSRAFKMPPARYRRHSRNPGNSPGSPRSEGVRLS